MRGDLQIQHIAGTIEPLDLSDMPSETMMVERLISAETFAQIWDCSLKTVNRIVRQPEFPQPIYLSPMVRRWNAVEYNAWISRLRQAQAKRKQ